MTWKKTNTLSKQMTELLSYRLWKYPVKNMRVSYRSARAADDHSRAAAGKVRRRKRGRMDFLDDLFIALRAEDMLKISPPEFNEVYAGFADKWLHKDSAGREESDNADEEFDNVVYLAQRAAFFEGMAFERKLSAALADRYDTACAEGDKGVDKRLIMAAIGIDSAVHGLDLAKTTLRESFGEKYYEELKAVIGDERKIEAIEKYSDLAEIAADRISAEKTRLQGISDTLAEMRRESFGQGAQ